MGLKEKFISVINLRVNKELEKILDEAIEEDKYHTITFKVLRGDEPQVGYEFKLDPDTENETPYHTTDEEGVITFTNVYEGTHNISAGGDYNLQSMNTDDDGEYLVYGTSEHTARFTVTGDHYFICQIGEPQITSQQEI